MKHLSSRRIAWLVIALPAIFIVLSALIVAAVHGEAMAQDTPTAEKVLDRFVEATGGLKAYEAIDNRKTTATLSIPAQGMSFSITMWSAKPNKVYSVIENDMIGKMEKGVSGDVVWEKSIMTGPIIKSGVERDITLRDSVFERYVFWRDNFEKVELEGEDKVAGAECWIVVLIPAIGDPFSMFFEKESGLLVRVDTVTETEMGRIPVSAYMSDYREQDGVVLSYKTTIKMMGQERVFAMTSIEQNIELPAGIFDLPDDIKALQE